MTAAKNPMRRVGALAAAIVPLLGGCGAPGEPPAPTPPPFAISETMRAAAAATGDVETMLDDLTRIQGWHAYRLTGVAPALQGGVPQAELDALEAGLGCRFPDELRALWRWRDGQADPEGAFTYYHRLLPVREAIAEYRTLRADPHAGWDASWLPVLQFQDEWYFVECGAAPAGASPLMLFFPETGPSPAYASLTAYFATMAEAMAAGTVTHGADGLAADERALAALHARHNPGVPFPYHVPEESPDAAP